MKSTTSHFVRCVRPNNDSVPDSFDAINVVRQLRYSGVIEALRIQRLGFPNKFGYHDFIRCFDILFSDELRWGVNSSPEQIPVSDIQSAVDDLFKNNLCRKADLGKHSYKFGKTRLFLRIYVITALENIKSLIILSHVKFLQQVFRRRLASQRFQRVQTAANLLQRHVRGILARRHHKIMVAEMHRKSQEMKREMEARKAKEEENLRVEKATEILNSAQELLDELQASRNIEGHQLIVVDVEVRSQYDKSILILQEAIESHISGGTVFLTSAKRALNSAKQCKDAFEVTQKRMEEEYYRQIELQEKLAADEKRREEMRESMERTLMMQEEDYIRKYFARVKKIEMVKEKSERYAMKREEDYLKWVLNEQRRQQILREKVELKRMRSEEESQRRMTIAIQKEKMKLEERLKREEIQREHTERQMMEAEETYQRWLITEAVRLHEMALKEQYNHDLAVAKIERHAMQLEEEGQRTFEMNVWRRYQKSKMLWQRVEEERRLNELTTMQKEEEYQKLVEHKNRISALEKRNSDRERVLMQAEDMQSKMYSLNQSIGSHMLNIRKFEKGHTEKY